MKASFFPGRWHELPSGDLADCVDVGRMVEDAGLYGIQMGDHVVMGNRPDRYPYGQFRHELECPWPEPIATLSAIAAVTSTIRLSMSVILTPLRPAILLAKQLATLDVLSRGRLEPGIGLGWQREEYEAEGLEWRDRHQLFEDGIAVCRALWEEEQPVSFKGETVSFADLYALPRPVQSRIPILFGVVLNERNIELITRLGDGWTPVAGGEELRAGRQQLQDAFTAAGRDPDELIVRGGVQFGFDDHGRLDIARAVDEARELEAIGSDVVTLGLPVGFGRAFETMADLGTFIAEVGRQVAE
ncbi:MAG: fmn-dependent monooxygenase [Acidimicrobiales bacterium]|nr:fmn-dependent monooxygenase [Acidimicrobiales bacterium]